MNGDFRRIAIAFLLLAFSGSLVAGIHRAVTPPANATTEVADALGIGSISGASVRGVVASVQGALITLNSGGAPAIVIDSSAAKFVTAKDGPGSIGDVRPGIRITAFINTAPTLQPSSFLRAQLITIESQPDLEVTGTIDSIDLPHSRFNVLGISVGVDANTGFGSIFPTFAPIRGLGDLAAGEVVYVTARLTGGAIVATRVQVMSFTIQPATILVGTVKSIAPTAWVIASREGKETTVSVNAQTSIVGDPKVGDSVQVMANIDSAHNYVATAIVKLDFQPTTTELHGIVKSISSSEWIIGGPPGTLTPDFMVMISRTTVIYPNPKIGDHVVAVGTRDSKGTFTATKIGKDG
jgi:hypothetical protein